MNPLQDALDILKERRIGHYLVLALIFLLISSQAFFAGQYLYKTDKEKTKELLKQIADSDRIRLITQLFEERDYFMASLVILLNNFLIGAYSMYLGILIVIPPMVLLLNSIAIGLLFGIQSMVPPSPTLPHLLSIILVGVLELSAMLLTAYEGLRIGISWINPRFIKERKRINALKRAITEGTRILPLILVILIIAAIIETMAIAVFSTRFAH